jgi:hypothetical protein
LAALALLEKVIDVGLSLAGTSAKVSGTVEATRKAWREAEPDLTKLSDGQRFYLLFEDAVETVLKSLQKNQHSDDNDTEESQKARLIIFIDDLDRCE